MLDQAKLGKLEEIARLLGGISDKMDKILRAVEPEVRTVCVHPIEDEKPTFVEVAQPPRMAKRFNSAEEPAQHAAALAHRATFQPKP